MIMDKLSTMNPKTMAATTGRIQTRKPWAVMNDRPTKWACPRRNWPLWARRWPIPSNALYELASERGWQLVAPRKKPKTGLGHRRHSALVFEASNCSKPAHSSAERSTVGALQSNPSSAPWAMPAADWVRCPTGFAVCPESAVGFRSRSSSTMFASLTSLTWQPKCNFLLRERVGVRVLLIPRRHS